jgi:hypothetical protein
MAIDAKVRRLPPPCHRQSRECPLTEGRRAVIDLNGELSHEM